MVWRRSLGRERSHTGVFDRAHRKETESGHNHLDHPEQIVSKAWDRQAAEGGEQSVRGKDQGVAPALSLTTL